MEYSAKELFKKIFSKKNLPVFLLLLVIVWGALLRIKLSQFNSQGLIFCPDAKGFFEIVTEMKHPFDTKHREPLYLNILKIWLKGTSHSIKQLRSLTIIFSLLLIAVTFWFGSKLFPNPYIGLMASLLVATNPMMLFTSMRGLRFEMFISLLLIFVGLLMDKDFKATPKRFFYLGLVASAIALTRLNNILPMAVLLSYWIIKKKISWNSYKWCFLTFIVCVSPYLLWCQHKHGNALYSISKHASWYNNFEKIHLKKVTKQKIKDFGEDINWFGYFSRHTPVSTITKLIGGYWNMLINPGKFYVKLLMGYHQWLFYFLISYILYITGIIWMALSRERMFLVVPILFLNIIPFFAFMNATPRLMFHIYPFVAIIQSWAAYQIFNKLMLLKNKGGLSSRTPKRHKNSRST